MIDPRRFTAAFVAAARAFGTDSRGASAVEFAIVSTPFILLLLAIVQIGIYFMTQSALDAGVVRTADTLVASYYSGSTPAAMTASSLQSMIVSNGGGLVRSDSAMAVDFRLLSNLAAGTVPIANVIDTTQAGSLVAIRAQAGVVSIVPGLGTMTVRSTALLRRQNQ